MADGSWHNYNNAYEACGEFLYFDWVEDRNKRDRLFINDIEFNVVSGVIQEQGFYSSKVNRDPIQYKREYDKITKHIEECVEVYKSFYQGIDDEPSN